MIIGAVGAFNTPTLTPGTNFIAIKATSSQAPSALAEYQLVSSAQSGLSVDASDGGVNTPWTIIADAVVSPGAIPDLPAGVLLLAVPVVAIYTLARKKALGRRATHEHPGVPPAAVTSHADGQNWCK